MFTNRAHPICSKHNYKVEGYHRLSWRRTEQRFWFPSTIYEVVSTYLRCALYCCNCNKFHWRLAHSPISTTWKRYNLLGTVQLVNSILEQIGGNHTLKMEFLSLYIGIRSDFEVLTITRLIFPCNAWSSDENNGWSFRVLRSFRNLYNDHLWRFGSSKSQSSNVAASSHLFHGLYSWNLCKLIRWFSPLPLTSSSSHLSRIYGSRHRCYKCFASLRGEHDYLNFFDLWFSLIFLLTSKETCRPMVNFGLSLRPHYSSLSRVGGSHKKVNCIRCVIKT